MGWKLVVAGALAVALAVPFLASGGGSLGFGLLLAGALAVPLGMLMHIDRRAREIARQLSGLQSEIRARRGGTPATDRVASGPQPERTRRGVEDSAERPNEH